MDTALGDAEGVDPDDFSAVGSISTRPFGAKQDGASGKPANITLQGADASYIENVHYGFDMTAEGYDSSREVWQELKEEPNTAVVSASLVASKSATQDGEVAAPFQFKGFYKEDRTIPEGTYVYVEDPRTGESEKLRVIGVLEQTATDITAVATSKATLEELAGGSGPATDIHVPPRRRRGRRRCRQNTRKGCSPPAGSRPAWWPKRFAAAPSSAS